MSKSTLTFVISAIIAAAAFWYLLPVIIPVSIFVWKKIKESREYITKEVNKIVK